MRRCAARMAGATSLNRVSVTAITISAGKPATRWRRPCSAWSRCRCR
jgi:hypothetical protein